MIPTKRVAGALGIAAGVALIAFTGPAAVADGATHTLVSADKPANPGSQGNGHADKNGAGVNDQNGDQTQTQDRTRHMTQDQTQTRAELRDQIRLNGGSWGAYQRQDSLVRVANRLAERYAAGADITDAASLGRILTLINLWLPADLQVDVAALLAQYGLTPADIKWLAGVTPEPSPSPSPSPSASPSASPSVTPSVSPTA
jgi:hypothetical protein